MKQWTLFNFALAPNQAKRGTCTVAAFNALGFLLLVVAEWNSTPPLAPLTSAALGLVILSFLKIRWDSLSMRLNAGLFVANTLSVIAALWALNSFYVTHLTNWVAFQPAQLGCILLALVAPSFALGVFAIAAQVGACVAQYLTFTPENRLHIVNAQLQPILAFGLAAVLILIFRYRNLVNQKEYQDAKVEAAAAQIIADKYLMIRDKMNTPLQTLTSSITLLEQTSEQKAEFLKACQRAVEQLKHLNGLLRNDDSKPNPK